MFSDPRARRAVARFRTRAKLMLSAVSPSVRRELIDDLDAHIQELVAGMPGPDSEFERVRAALDRMGDPREFLAPLVGEAIFRDPPRDFGIGQARSALAYGLKRGSRLTRQAVSIVLAGVFAALALLVSLGSLLLPENIGVFLTDPDTIQVRLLGGEGGEPLFAPWLAIALLGVGILVARQALAAGRHLALRIMTRERTDR